MTNAGYGNQSQEAGRRAQSRLRTFLPARLTTLDGRQSVVLSDLSPTGARLTLSKDIRLNQEGVLEWDRHEAFGTIVWFKGRECGLHFDETLPMRILVATRELHDATGLRSLRELDREMARAWVIDQARL